ncbi:MAG: hypothetical protein DCC66_13145 [Planctomycetota bacterium]|nr:MAG: hypothetical protein DCC66_13145 [Planctomycetota bacterium]
MLSSLIVGLPQGGSPIPAGPTVYNLHSYILTSQAGVAPGTLTQLRAGSEGFFGFEPFDPTDPRRNVAFGTPVSKSPEANGPTRSFTSTTSPSRPRPCSSPRRCCCCDDGGLAIASIGAIRVAAIEPSRNRQEAGSCRSEPPQ